MLNKLVIVWSAKDRTSGRSQRIADVLGAALRYIYFPTLWGISLPLPLRYLLQSVVTFFVILVRRPGVITLQLPPVIAAFPVFWAGKLCGSRIHLDFHTSFQDATWRKFHKYHRKVAAKATYVTAHNKEDFALIQTWAPEHASVLKSPAMERADLAIDTTYLEEIDLAQYAGKVKVMFVNRFASDDPYEEVLALAEERRDAVFFVTGNPDKVALDPKSLPENVVLTGFIHPSKFLALMDACDVVLSLTTRPGTLLWSIREALALGKPVVTSEHTILQDEFGEVAFFTNHEIADLAQKIDQALAQEDELKVAADRYIQADKQRWRQDIEALKGRLGVEE